MAWASYFMEEGALEGISLKIAWNGRLRKGHRGVEHPSQLRGSQAPPWPKLWHYGSPYVTFYLRRYAIYGWQDNDRLASVSGPGVNVQYEHDADGRRVKESSSGQVRQYLVDRLLPFGQVVLETDDSGNPTTRHVFGLERISQDRNGQISFFLADGQGSIRQLTDTAGIVTDEHVYSAFGEDITTTGTTPHDFRYAGELFDQSSGLYHLRARQMNPKTGRFLSIDPANGCLTCPLTLNKYLYADANPVIKRDPSGLFSLSSVLATVAVSNILAAHARVGVMGGEIKMGISIPTGTQAAQNLFDNVASSSSDPGRWSRQNTGQGMLTYMGTQSKGLNKIKLLTIAGHGWAFDPENPGNLGPGIPGVGDNVGFYWNEEPGIPYGPGARFIKDFAFLVSARVIKFAENSTVQIHACHMDPAFGSSMSTITNGKVISASGACFPDAKRWRSAASSEDEKNSGKNTGFNESYDGTTRELGEYYGPQ